MQMTTLGDNKQNVKTLLRSGIECPFLIPEYQRPYAWTFEQVETLFNDIWDFTETSGGPKRKATYFLGTIVAFINKEKDNKQEIIDGQQRITSLFLLLRAIYEKLKRGAETKESINFIQEIEKSIWNTDELTGEVFFDEILISSEVVSQDSNEILLKILETGVADPKAKDRYSLNYRRFQELFEDASANSPLMIYNFIYALLNQAVLLPIMAVDQDNALTIFSTLNDRGMPLSDADIYKAKLYNSFNSKEEKESFIADWKELDENAAYAKESIQQLFYYYMFYLRAMENDSSSTTPGGRKYFLNSSKIKERLYSPHLMKHLKEILNFWLVVTKQERIDGEPWCTDQGILRVLDILTSYPNEYWKYPVITYYLSHKDKADFQKCFLVFLHNLVYYLLTRYLIAPTINAVKGDIMKLNVAINKDILPQFVFRDVDLTQLPAAIKSPNRNAVRMLLKIIAYLDPDQEGILQNSWEIEHIFPQKWQENYFPSIPDDIIRDKIEHIGNKLPFEKKLNISAANGYFLKKKEYYIQSRFAVTKKMSSSSIQEWSLDNITERDVMIDSSIRNILERWNAEYQQASKPQETTDSLTPAEWETIRKAREKGFI